MNPASFTLEEISLMLGQKELEKFQLMKRIRELEAQLPKPKEPKK
jgi:hypothetical protein